MLAAAYVLSHQGANIYIFCLTFTAIMTAKELQRVAVLNVLGKPFKNFKEPADDHDCLEKEKAST